MHSAKIKTYLQSRPKEWLKRNPHEKWRCDIFPDDGSDHHGIGRTEAEAIRHAAQAYYAYVHRDAKLEKPSPAP